MIFPKVARDDYANRNWALARAAETSDLLKWVFRELPHDHDEQINLQRSPLSS